VQRPIFYRGDRRDKQILSGLSVLCGEDLGGNEMRFFESLSGRFGVASELLHFFWERKLWWLMPMVILLLGFGLLIVFAQSSAVAPFIYTLF